ncbi:phosphoglycerate mutase family protein [Bdellovibrio sp. HCB185ZH]|uniref:phosphoglycerate mutase family protein n=1 Tax=Bdellovibrio sp. HCB185ZH TaxID=3394235 RepID=UPI0039A77913
MKIYIFRHAQKAMDFSGDPDLTPEGHGQASTLLDLVLKNEMPKPTQLWVSPRKRTHSTFRPLSEQLKLPLVNQEALLEQQGDESLQIFRRRISNLLEKASEATNDVIFMCSHYDWVIEAMSVIPSETDLSDDRFNHWTPCQCVGFEVAKDGMFKFLELKKVST